MIVFRGTVKEFLKNYPKDERKIGEIYQISTSKRSHNYQFINGISEKCFKRMENIKNSSNNELKELQEIARFLEFNKDDEPELYYLCRWIKISEDVKELLDEDFIALFNILYRFVYFVDMSEARWEVKTKNEAKKISDFVCKVGELLWNRCGKGKLSKCIVNAKSVDFYANLTNEYDLCGWFLSQPTCTKIEFNLNSLALVKRLTQKFDRLIRKGYLGELNNIVDDWTKFGEIYGDKIVSRYECQRQSVNDLLEYFDHALSSLFLEYVD